MIFQSPASFRQLCHCNFRETIIKLLCIPKLNYGEPVFLIVNKYGKVGLYNTNSFALLHSYVLDLIVPMAPNMSSQLKLVARYRAEIHPPSARCQQTHLIVDAVYAPDFKSCMFLTTKGILQCYDIGEIETQSIGLELFPRKEFMGLKHGHQIIDVYNHGHVETHRLYGLHEFPTCMYYYVGSDSPRNAATATAGHTENSNQENNIGGATAASSVDEITKSKLLIGDSEGCITIITIDQQNTGHMFGLRKIRHVKHDLIAMDLFNADVLKIYKGHNGPVKQVVLLSPRQVVISCSSTDKKLSLFVNDLMVRSTKPYVVPSIKGINTFAHSTILKMIATGSDDCTIRLFNDFITRMPQMELHGHKGAVIAIEFINVSFVKSQLLLSFSKDVELRAWDPINFICLQSIYISFPPKCPIICKTPEFAKNCLYIHQPQFNTNSDGRNEIEAEATSFAHAVDDPEERVLELITKNNSDNKKSEKLYDGYIILFYCNSYTKINIIKADSHWPFDFDDFIDEFEEASAKLEQKFLHKQQSISKDPKTYQPKQTLSPEELVGIEKNLDSVVNDILGIKKFVDKKLGIQRSFEFDVPSKSKGKTTESQEDIKSKMSLSVQALKRFHSLERAKKASSSRTHRRQSLPNATTEMIKMKSQSHFIQQGLAFKSMPIYNVEPITFKSKYLPITDTMKESGLGDIGSIADLLTPQARKYFSDENMTKVRGELEIMGKTLRNSDSDLESNESSDKEDEDANKIPMKASSEASSICSSVETNKSKSQKSSSTSKSDPTSKGSKTSASSNQLDLEVSANATKIFDREETVESIESIPNEKSVPASASPTISETDSARYDELEEVDRLSSEVSNILEDYEKSFGEEEEFQEEISQ